jgi:hypothetical protein
METPMKARPDSLHPLVTARGSARVNSREQAANVFNVHDTPTTFYVDASGTIRYQVTGVEPHGDAVDRVTWYIETLKAQRN